ncbi:hypothetical protein OS493_030387 [Desmophyllum pertusum]|uniref:Uncharacterized protein n=1 Tax=Desmophyllum pertusum TaxID=174260 RepID=A0A9X0CV52_9CNID|nr:hypothetical protein OS493_030387 [Desmophyllum pertusum]
MSSRKSKYPGCKIPKSSHQSGSPGKNCTGPSDATVVESSSSATTSDEPSMSVLLEAIQKLSMQMESLQTQHNQLKKQVQLPQPAPVLADQASMSNLQAQDTQWQPQQKPCPRNLYRIPRCMPPYLMPQPYALIPANARVVSPFTIWARNVHFPCLTTWRRLGCQNMPGDGPKKYISNQNLTCKYARLYSFN